MHGVLWCGVVTRDHPDDVAEWIKTAVPVLHGASFRATPLGLAEYNVIIMILSLLLCTALLKSCVLEHDMTLF